MTEPAHTVQRDWIARWQQVARRIRVPLGFLTAALYLFELGRRAPQPAAMAWSLALVVPGLWLRGFTVALLSWPVALVLAAGFAVIYIPVIASEERFLRAAFPEYDDYCRRVPRLIPRLTPARNPEGESAPGAFSFTLYRQHREYNAVLGAALLYLCLLLLRSAFNALVHGLR
jgi:hypothetical protein